MTLPADAARRRPEIARLLAAERAAQRAGEGAVRWWGPLRTSAEGATTQGELDDVLRIALNAVRSALGADSASLLLAEEGVGDIVSRASVGLVAAISSDLRIVRGTGVAGTVVATGEPVVIGDLGQVKLASPTLSEVGMRSLVAVPVVAGAKSIGVLHAASRALEHFDHEDSEALQLIADRLGSAIERVQLFESERAARDEAEVSARRLERLQRVTARLAGEVETERVAEVLRTELAPEFGGGLASCAVWMVEGSQLVLLPEPEVAGRFPSADPFATMPLESELPGPAVVRTGLPLFLSDDAERDARYPRLAGTETLARSYAVLPLHVGDQVLGVLAIGLADPHEFDEGERAHLVAVAEQAALAFDRARLRARLEVGRRLQDFLFDVAKVLAASAGFDETLQHLALVAVPRLADLCLIDILDDEGELRRMVAHHADPCFRAATEQMGVNYPPLLGGPHPSAKAIASGRSLWSNDMSDEFLRATTRDDAHFEITKALQFRSYIAVPLAAEGEILGAMVLVSSGSGRRFEPDDLALAETLAEQVATVVARARRYERARSTSEVLQARLLPRKLPVIEGAQLAFSYLPRTIGVEVGGDFYDVISATGDAIWLMLGDVAGHDRLAAGQMGDLRTAARALSGQVRRPAGLIAALRQNWQRIEMDRIATAVFCRLDVRTGSLSVASAGHPMPLLVDAAGARFLEVKPSTPLGGPRSRTYEWQGTLEPEVALLLYSDGVIQDRERIVGLDEAMAQLLSLAGDCPPDPALLCERVQSAMGSDRSDDVALLAVVRSA